MMQGIWFSTPQQLLKLDLPFSQNLDIVLDLTLSEHIANLTCSSYIHLSWLRATHLLSCLYLHYPINVHAFICS